MSATEEAQRIPAINNLSSTATAAPTRSALGGQNTSLGTFGVGDPSLGVILPP